MLASDVDMTYMPRAVQVINGLFRVHIKCVTGVLGKIYMLGNGDVSCYKVTCHFPLKMIKH